MPSHAQVAAKVRQDKERHPEKYCSEPRCLWKRSSGPCPKHGKAMLPQYLFPFGQHLEALEAAKEIRAGGKSARVKRTADGWMVYAEKGAF